MRLLLRVVSTHCSCILTARPNQIQLALVRIRAHKLSSKTQRFAAGKSSTARSDNEATAASGRLLARE